MSRLQCCNSFQRQNPLESSEKNPPQSKTSQSGNIKVMCDRGKNKF